jgi:hypothetical protein
MLDKIGATLETLPRNSCAANAAANRNVPVFVLKWNTTASIYNTTVLHKPQGADHEAKRVLCTHTFQGVCGDIYPTLILFNIEVWFHLSRYVTLHNNSYGSAEILVFIHSVLW